MAKATVQMCIVTTGFGPTATRAQRKDLVASSNAALRTPGLVRAVSSAITRQSVGQTNSAMSSRFDMNFSDLFSDMETKSQTISRPSYGLQASSHIQPHTLEPYQQLHLSTQYQPVPQPVADVYQQSVHPIANAPDMLDHDTTTSARLHTSSPYVHRQHAPEHFLQQDANASTYGTLPANLQAQFSSSSDVATGLSLPTDILSFDESFEAFNDPGFDFHNLNSMIGGGAGRGAALWEDGGWSTGLTGGGDVGTGAVGAEVEDSGGMSSGSAHNSGNPGGNGTIDMFDGLFFG